MASYIYLCFCFFNVVAMDYYAGVFNRNDFLVAQDTLYKERVPYRVTQSMYGRYFKCPITYFRVMDRLGMGRGPRVLVTRGGLRHRFLTLRISSQYNMPTSVTILVGCENKKPTTKRPTTVAPGGTTAAPGGTTAAPGGTTAAPGGTTAAPGGTSASPDGGTSAAPGGATSVSPGDTESVSPGGVTDGSATTPGGDTDASSTTDAAADDASTTNPPPP